MDRPNILMLRPAGAAAVAQICNLPSRRFALPCGLDCLTMPIRPASRSPLSAGQTLGQGGQFGPAAVGLPDHPAVFEQADNPAVRRTAKGLDPITRLKGSRLAKALDDFHHVFPWKNAGDVVGNGRYDFAAATCGQIGKNRRCDLPANISKGVAVEKEKGGAAMALPQEFYGFGEGEDLLLLFRPFACGRFLSLSIKAVLRASSCARSSIEADDKLPTPVFEKSGSGL